MIESDKTFGTFTMYCDTCDHDETFETDGDWQAMIAEAKAKGWKMRRDSRGEWHHYCPECAKDVT